MLGARNTEMQRIAPATDRLVFLSLYCAKYTNRQILVTQCAKCLNKDNGNKTDGIIKFSRIKAQGEVREGLEGGKQY